MLRFAGVSSFNLSEATRLLWETFQVEVLCVQIPETNSHSNRR
jgi:hypothetical protein